MERASTANQIQGFRIPDRKNASEKNKMYYLPDGNKGSKQCPANSKRHDLGAVYLTIERLAGNNRMTEMKLFGQ